MNPHTSLAVEPIPANGRHPGLVPRARLEYMLETFSTNYAASGFVKDKRLPMHAEIAGVSFGGVDKAYPLEILREQGIINDRVGGQDIAIIYDAEADHLFALDRSAGDASLNLVLAGGALSSPGGEMRWTGTGLPLTDNAPQLQRLQIERQWWLGWVEFHPRSEIYQIANI